MCLINAFHLVFRFSSSRGCNRQEVVKFADFYSLWNMPNISVVSLLFLIPLCLKKTTVSSSSDSVVQSPCVLLPSPLAAEDDDVPRRFAF
jgi:hypothetical protein